MICIVCGKKAESNFCFQHKPRKPLRANRSLQTHRKEQMNEDIDEMRSFFLSIWSKRPHYSEVSGVFLGGTPLTIFFHHILPKEKYFYAKDDEENIILLTFTEHLQVENNMYAFEEINQRRDYLKTKYNL